MECAAVRPPAVVFEVVAAVSVIEVVEVEVIAAVVDFGEEAPQEEVRRDEAVVEIVVVAVAVVQEAA